MARRNVVALASGVHVAPHERNLFLHELLELLSMINLPFGQILRRFLVIFAHRCIRVDGDGCEVVRHVNLVRRGAKG